MTELSARQAPERGGFFAWLDSRVAVQLMLIALAVMATLIKFWPPATLLWWLLAAGAVVSVLLHRPGRDAIDWIARGLGIVICGVVLLGVVLDALSIPLDSTSWALTLGGIGAIIVIAARVWDKRRARRHGYVEAAAYGSSGRADGSATEDLVRSWEAVTRRKGQAVWVLTAAVLVGVAVAIGAVSEPKEAPELQLSLAEPAAASTRAQRVTVTVTARDHQDNLVLRVTPALGPADQRTQRFSVGAGESVDRVVTLPVTGPSQIELTSPGNPALARILTVNR